MLKIKQMIFIFIFKNRIVCCNCLPNQQNCIKDVIDCKFPKQNNFISILYFIIILIFWYYIITTIIIIFEKIWFCKINGNNSLYDTLVNNFYKFKKKFKYMKINKIVGKKRNKKLTKLNYEFSQNIIKIKFNKTNNIFKKLDKEF